MIDILLIQHMWYKVGIIMTQAFEIVLSPFVTKGVCKGY